MCQFFYFLKQLVSLIDIQGVIIILYLRVLYPRFKISTEKIEMTEDSCPNFRLKLTANRNISHKYRLAHPLSVSEFGMSDSHCSIKNIRPVCCSFWNLLNIIKCTHSRLTTQSVRESSGKDITPNFFHQKSPYFRDLIFYNLNGKNG